MLSRLGHIIKEVTEYYSQFLFHKVYRLIYNFCVYEISSVYLDVLKDRLYTFKKDSRQRRSAQTVIYKILDCLTRMLSPILSFTAEEVWQETAILKKCDSIHLSNWPDKDNDINEWIDKELDKKWEILISVRQGVQKALEEERTKGIIGSSLDAKVQLYTKDDKLRKLLKTEENSLPVYFIVSQVKVTDQQATSGSEFSEPGIFVSVAKADGGKCQRCWNYSDSVGEDKNHKDICKKCIDNI